ncbi:hypothetical protein DE146DRAFT_493101 [Phaeosphaeria sp. MPI-PUGE-AT-0046c]|nr:hypothetical protein DE146DRAFT_493101 [Phaeosphaeria sp. MPI-PUGE-AT-0046c]
MAYNPIGQYDQTYYQDPEAFTQGYELRSTAPSFAIHKSNFTTQFTAAQDDTPSQHLLRGADQNVHGSKWSPGFWRQFPWLALSSLLGVLGSTIASVVILTRSHQRPLDQWGYGIPPSVYLAIASVVANALTAYAITCGLEIDFWRNALQGRTLAGLNQNWLNGHSLYNALIQGYRSGGRITALGASIRTRFPPLIAPSIDLLCHSTAQGTYIPTSFDSPERSGIRNFRDYPTFYRAKAP